LAPPSDSGTDAGADLEGGAGVCTKACCTSSDCDKGSVCFATGGGGNYCVPAATLGDRATTGPLNAPAGQACDAGSSCRSGLCSSIPSFCADTCCAGPARSMANSAGQCLQGMACRIGTFQGAGNDMNYVPRCAVPMGASGNNGSPCTSNSDCRSNLCLNDTAQDLTCRDPCRKPEDCSGMGMFQAAQTCEYLQLSGTGAAINPLVAACVPLTPSGPNLPDAAADWGPCKTSSDCARGYCGQSTAGMVCVSVCFGDGDCVSSGMCRPQTLLVNGAVYSVLACK
jgi:hypothetical protein